MRTLYFDCGMGAAGDMLTGALLELHPEPDAFLNKINAALDGKVILTASQDEKRGVLGTHITVTVEGDEEGEAVRHSHRHTDICEIMNFIDAVGLPHQVKANAKAVYAIIAEAESAVHGTPVENIHLHEVGSLDALADVLSVCLLICELSPNRITASPINVGSGTVKCAHGVLPVPAPATKQLLRGLPNYTSGVSGELCTPTGAALLRHFVSDFGPMPGIDVKKVGCGTGKKDFKSANVLRAILGNQNG